MAPAEASAFDIVLNGLLDRYEAHVPDVDAILRAMADERMIERILLHSTYTAQAVGTSRDSRGRLP